VGVDEDERLGFGANLLRHMEVAPDAWRLRGDSVQEWWEREAPFVRFDLGTDEGANERDLGPLAGPFATVEPVRSPSAFAANFDTHFADGGEISVSRVVVRLHRPDGSFAGLLAMFVGGGLRSSLQTMLARGDQGMFERMAELTEPERRPAAVLFADLEASGVLSRHLSSKAYFRLIRDLTTAIDDAIVEAGGIVGKHAGDGVSAFFLAEQCGRGCEGEEDSHAAAAALQAAVAIRERAGEIATPGDPPRINVGLHWGATLVIGQVVTGGRLEVTALGDEVNEAARVQEVATGGRILATKDLIERLPADIAETFGFEPDAIQYEILAEMPGASDKARRDAGGLAICEIPA
jgi:class 3 adenylate cyclase